MITAAVIRKMFFTFTVGALLVAGPVGAQYDEPDPKPTGPRMEAWLALSSWPSLTDLEPVVGGSFKGTGFGLGASGHWAFRQTGNGMLMLGFETAIIATDSDIPVVLDDLLARRLYLAASAKYLMGEARNLSLDAGFGFHLVDIAQLSSDYRSGSEFETWEETAVGPFVGLTWDIETEDVSNGSAVTFGLRAHFLDFGTVRDEAVLGSVIFGSSGGELDGPMYEVRIGYRWR